MASVDIPKGGPHAPAPGRAVVAHAVTDPAAAPSVGRLRSLDATRGAAIAVMVVVMHPGDTHDPGWMSHPVWHGLGFIDLFFPLFLFSMGVSMALSRRAASVPYVARRVGALMLLGIALTSLRHEKLVVTGVLQHIAVAYVLAYAILRTSRRWQVPIAAGIIAGGWLAHVLWVGPAADPWARGANLAHAVDTWLFGSFRTEGAIQTVVSTAAVVAGARAGLLIRERRRHLDLVKAYALRAALLVALAVLLVVADLVPLNKRLWSPSFNVLTIGTSFAIWAAAVWLADIRRAGRLTAPFVHLGANPIAIYVLSMTGLAVLNNWGRHLTPSFAPVGHPVLGALTYAVLWASLWWLVAYVLVRRRIFIKI